MKISKTKKYQGRECSRILKGSEEELEQFKIDLKKMMQENGNGKKQSNESFQKVLKKEINRKK